MPAHPPDEADLTVVIPAYNEAQRLGPAVERIDRYAADTGRRIELIVVDDASSDDTAGAARRAARANLYLRVLVNDRNRGKGYSVRRGVLEAAGRAVLMSDADLSTPIDQLDKLLPWLDRGRDVVIASRDMPDSALDPPQPPLRRLINVLFRAVRRLIMLRDIRDTQCGFKLFSRSAARDIFSRAKIDGFAFDCEALALARRLGYRIAEVGVVWRNDPRSTLHPLYHSIEVARDLLRIRLRLGPAPAPGSRPPPPSDPR